MQQHGGSYMRWIIGIVVVVVIAILGYQYFGGPRDVDVAGQVEEGADQAAQDTEEAAEATGQAAEEAVEGAGQTTEETAEEATTGAGQAVGEAQETAEQAGESAEESAEQAAAGAEQATEEAAEATQEAADQAQQTAEQATAGAQQATDEAAEATQETAEQAAEETQQATEQAAEATDEAAQATEEAAEATTAGAQETLTEAQSAALTVGDVNLGERVTAALQDARASLEGVTDAESARAAVPALTEINTQLEDLSSTVGQLPEDAKKILADLLRGDVTELKTLGGDVTSQEGVGDVLNPVLEPIMAKLDSWAQQPA
jgi:hypothetical protein